MPAREWNQKGSRAIMNGHNSRGRIPVSAKKKIANEVPLSGDGFNAGRDCGGSLKIEPRHPKRKRK